MATSRLNIPELEEAQAQKVVTINEAFEAIDGAIAGVYGKTLTSADLVSNVHVLPSDVWNEHVCFSFGGTLSNTITLQVPGTEKMFAVYNFTGQTINVRCQTDTNTVSVPNGSCKIIVCNGTRVIEA